MMALRRGLVCFFALGLPGALNAQAPIFSEWNQATGLKTIEYRWKLSDSSGCDVEYRNSKTGDKRSYKARVVFQNKDEEQDQPNAVISFADGTGSAVGHIPACTLVTDISITRF